MDIKQNIGAQRLLALEHKDCKALECCGCKHSPSFCVEIEGEVFDLVIELALGSFCHGRSLGDLVYPPARVR